MFFSIAQSFTKNLPPGRWCKYLLVKIISLLPSNCSLASGKETDIHIQEAQTVTNRINPKIATSKYIVIKIAKIKDKENINSSKGKSTGYIQGNFIKAISWLAEILQARREWHGIFKGIIRENLQSKNTLPGKTFIQIWWEDQKFYRQAKTRREQHQQTNFTRSVKETFLTKKEKITNRNIKLWIKKSHW